MTLPAGIRSAIDAVLAGAHGGGSRIVRVAGVGGGCISPSARVETAGGARWFVKWSDLAGTPPAFFAEEARSLRSLNEAGAVRVPRVEGVGPDWLLLEWLEPGRATDDSWAELGRGLAALHRRRQVEFGWPADNWIGSLPQPNGAAPSWPEFWADRRLGPQWEMARGAGHFVPADERAFGRLLTRLTELVSQGGAEGASLLHGDLWSGNVHVVAGGEPAIVDPSSYHGHREVDLAMAELFGGFDHAFFEAYDEAWPLEPGYREARRELYQLYYLLVHVNLFGAAYVARTRSVLRRFGG